MRLLLVTQNEPFYLANNIRYLLSNLSNDDSLVGCVLLSPSPYGRKVSFINKTLKTLSVFGFKFVVYYGIRFIVNTFNRKNSVRAVLNDFSIPIIQLKKSINSKESLEIIGSYKPDLIVSILGNEIFKQKIISLPSLGCINLHTSLLPKYRGLMPTFWVLKNSEKETGVSVFYMDNGIDSGPIIVQERVPIPIGFTQEKLIRLTKQLGMDLVLKAISLIKGGDVKTLANNSVESTYFSMPKRQDVKEFLASGKRFF